MPAVRIGILQMAQFFVVSRPPSLWGDYGDILAHGLVDSAEDSEHAVRLLRTGPFVPPVTQPFGHIIVVDALRTALERSELTGFRFLEVEYRKVVRLDWHTWSIETGAPRQYPDSGEPEDYVLAGSHDPSLQKEMPRLWSLQVAPTPDLQIDGSPTFRAIRHPGTDIAREFRLFWVSDRMKSFLQKAAGDWIKFKPVSPR